MNGGQTWSQPIGEPNGPGPDFLMIWRGDHNVMLHMDAGYINKSTNFGRSWTTRQFGGWFTAALTGLYQDPFRDSTIYVTGMYGYSSNLDTAEGGLRRSDDLGETWRLLIDFHSLYAETLASVDCMAKLANGSLIAVSSYIGTPLWENGTIFLSSDDGQTWARIESGMPNRFMPYLVLEDRGESGTVFMAGRQKYGLYWSHDFGNTWSRCLNGLPGNVAYIEGLYQNPFSREIYVVISGWGVFQSGDHGQNWQLISMPPLGNSGWLGSVDSTAFMRDDAYRQWRLEPDATQWQEMSFPLAADTLVLMRPVCYQHGDTLVSGLWKRNVLGAATDVFQMMYSHDNGGTWQLDPFLSFLPELYFDVHPTRSGVRLLDYTPGGNDMRTSENLGRTWLSTLAPAGFGFHVAMQNDTAIYALAEDWGDCEVFRTTDDGVTWDSLNYQGDAFDYYTAPVFSGAEMLFTAGSHSYAWTNGQWEERGTVPHYADLTFLINVPNTQPVLFGLGFFVNRSWLSFDAGRTWEEHDIEVPYPTQTVGFLDLRYKESDHRIWAISGVGTCYLDASELSLHRAAVPQAAGVHRADGLSESVQYRDTNPV